MYIKLPPIKVKKKKEKLVRLHVVIMNLPTCDCICGEKFIKVRPDQTVCGLTHHDYLVKRRIMLGLLDANTML